MKVSPIYLDERRAKVVTSPEWCFTVRSGCLLDVRRSHDRERLEAERAQLLSDGAEAA